MCFKDICMIKVFFSEPLMTRCILACLCLLASRLSLTIGNDPLHQLTKKNVSLYISMTGLNGSSFYKEYPYFFIESEATKYRLHIGGTPTGTFGNFFFQHFFDLKVHVSNNLIQNR